MIDQARDIAVALESENPGDIWHCPIFTVSLSEGGFEKVYQGTTFVNRFDFRLSKEPTTLRFSLTAGSKEGVLASLGTVFSASGKTS